MGKFVIGLRTDVRSPMEIQQTILGACIFSQHINPPIHIPLHTLKNSGRNQQIAFLVKMIDAAVKNAGISHQHALPEYAKNNPIFSPF